MLIRESELRVLIYKVLQEGDGEGPAGIFTSAQEFSRVTSGWKALKEFIWKGDVEDGKSKSALAQIKNVGSKNFEKMLSKRQSVLKGLASKTKKGGGDFRAWEVEATLGYKFGQMDNEKKGYYAAPGGLRLMVGLINSFPGGPLKPSASGVKLFKNASSLGLKSEEVRKKCLGLLKSRQYQEFVSAVNDLKYILLSDTAILGLQETFMSFFKLCLLNDIDNIAELSACPVIEVYNAFASGMHRDTSLGDERASELGKLSKFSKDDSVEF